MERSKLVVTSLDLQIAKLVRESDHKTLVIWATDCAKRVLPYFEKNFPEDTRPQEAITAIRDAFNSPNTEAVVNKERQWQYQHLIELTTTYRHFASGAR